MIVEESTFSSLRQSFGGPRRELRIFSWGQHITDFETHNNLKKSMPKDIFSNTWDEFSDELPNPLYYGDKGRERLEVVILLALSQHVPVLVEGVPWLALTHQAGGIECGSPQFVARRIKPRASIYPGLRKIARDRWPNDPGDRYDPSNDAQTLSLKKDLGMLGLTCEHTMHCFTESVYPIDVTENSLDIITDERINLHDLILNFDAGYERSNLALIILTENSD